MAPTALVASLRLRPKFHVFDLSLYLLQSWLYNIDSESIKWSLSIIVQICGVPTFLGLHSHLLSTDADCLVIILGGQCNMVDFYRTTLC